MRDNLDLLGGQILSERVMLALGARMGKQSAHELVHEISLHARREEIAFKDALLKDERLRGSFTAQALEDLLDPVTYVGLAADMVDRLDGDAGQPPPR